MINQKQLLKTIIKKIIITENLLTEAPIDVWKNKNKSLSQQQISQAEKYFADLTGKLNALLHPTTKDLTSFSFDQLETLFKAIEAAREKNLKTPYVQWLTKQLKQKNLNLQQAIEDYIPSLFSLQKNKNKFEPDVLDKLESIEQLNQQLNATISSTEMAVSDSDFGKLAEENGWVLYMPHTTEASCEIGKTGGRRDTTWCTTRPDSSNMFLQYSAQADANIVLFYVIKKGANAEKDPFAKMSVGFIDNEPKFDQGDGNVSVNANNDNLTKNKFEEVVGKDLADKFLRIMKEKSTSLGGEHPAKEEFRKLVQNPTAFKAKLDSFSDDENGRQLRNNFMETAAGYKEISPDILKTLAEDDNANVRISVAKNEKTPPEVFQVLATDPEIMVILEVAKNPRTPIEVLKNLLKIYINNRETINTILYENPAVTLELYMIALESPHVYVLRDISKNPNTPPEVLKILETNKDELVHFHVAGNPNTPSDALRNLAKDKDEIILNSVANNPNTPPDVLKILATNENDHICMLVAKNPNTPPDVLKILLTHKDANIRKEIASSKNQKLFSEIEEDKEGLNVLNALIKDRSEVVRATLASNHLFSDPKILTLFSTDESEYVRIGVAKNPNTPSDVLQVLARDENGYVRQAAIETLKKLGLMEAIIMEKVLWKLLKRID